MARKMRFGLPALGLALACLAGAVGFAPLAEAAGRNASDAAKAMRAKARHYFVKGAEADALGRDDEANEYYKLSLASDPSFLPASYRLGVSRLVNGLDTLSSQAEVQKSLDMVGRFVDSSPDDVQEGLYYAYLCRSTNRLEEAARVYERLVAMQPDRTQTLLNLTEVEAARGHLAKAASLVERYEAIEGTTPQLALMNIKLLYQSGDSLAAIEKADRVVAEHPGDADYVILRAHLLDALGRAQEAEQAMLDAERLDPSNASVKVALAEMAKERGDMEAYGEKVYEALLNEGLQLEEKEELLGPYLLSLLEGQREEEPEQPEPDHMLSQQEEPDQVRAEKKDSPAKGDDQDEEARKEADIRKAERLFRALNEQYPHNATLTGLEAHFRYLMGDAPEAAELQEYAVSLDPENPIAWETLSFYQMAAEQYADVERTLEKGNAQGMATPRMKLFAAIGAGIMEQRHRELELFSELLKEMTGSADLTQPISEIAPALRLDEHQLDILVQAYLSAGDAYQTEGERAKAYAAYGNALAIDDRNALALNNYAYYISQDPEAGEEELEKALEMSAKVIAQLPEAPTYLDTYAWILFKQGKTEEAIEVQEKAISLAAEEGEVAPEFTEHLNEMTKKRTK